MAGVDGAVHDQVLHVLDLARVAREADPRLPRQLWGDLAADLRYDGEAGEPAEELERVPLRSARSSR